MDEQTLKTLFTQHQRLADSALSQWSQAQQQTDHQKQVEKQLTTARKAAQSTPAVNADVRFLSGRQNFGVRLHDVCDQAAHNVARAQVLEDQKREEFTQRRKDRLVIEKLQERLANRRSLTQQKAEQRMLEDFVASRYGR